MSDVDLAVCLLRATPTHENRSDEQLRTWAEIALAYGDELAAGSDSGDIEVVEREGGVGDHVLLLAEHQRGTVVVYTEALRRVEELAQARGWPVTREALRSAAVAHELAHHRLDVRELNRRLGHLAIRLGPLRLRGHVAGAEEIAAHRFAHHRSGLAVSPLLITTALAGGN
ncbi:hypothetical protein DL991_29560 [Amycolatopsis sp. WAC 01375]|uniref:hypothetical protein n=1 Tax=unclassified Amycolatopsis TaxID=2618356 RepID=UPI000F77E323|nr:MULTISPECIES: hypothetical protein [unclassified Amycolatopsis]RSM74450.1 hypothetical protein DL991_29560 [Amycolatopsis sp. WAC 01375]RSN21530.1 hypothetical protein DL990_38755 [Amycolatopsis sp. WAC 01416]